MLYEECELINKYSKYGIKIPECIAIDPTDSRLNISIEVKRICGNHLPSDYEGQERRTLRIRDKIIWPWGETVKNSFIKAHPMIISDMNIHTHHNVFIVPSSLSNRIMKRVSNKIKECVIMYESESMCKHVVHIIKGNDELFDRL